MKFIKKENMITTALIIWLLILSCLIGYAFVQKEKTSGQVSRDTIAELSVSIIELAELIESDHERINLVWNKVNDHSKGFEVLTKTVLNNKEVLTTHENMWNVIINQ